MQYLFTDRKGGASAPPFSSFNLAHHVGDDPAAVRANRAALVRRLGVGEIGWMDQVHSATVRVITSAGENTTATDGLVTSTPGLALAVLVADCVPILAFDDTAGVIGVAHAGRVGAAIGIATHLIDVMEAQGARRAAVEVVFGPAICGRCYEVPPEMRDDVERRLPGSATLSDTATPALDLRAGLERQLRAAGIAAVHRDPRCTREDPDLFSHRREAPTGRQAGLIWLGPRSEDQLEDQGATPFSTQISK